MGCSRKVKSPAPAAHREPDQHHHHHCTAQNGPAPAPPTLQHWIVRVLILQNVNKNKKSSSGSDRAVLLSSMPLLILSKIKLAIGTWKMENLVRIWAFNVL